MANSSNDAVESAELTESSGRELDVSDASGAAILPHHNFFTRLYTGTGAFEVVGRRKLWFGISGLILLIAIGSMVLRGFTFGIDFEGGTKVSMPAVGISTEQVETVFHDTLGKDAESVVSVGNGDSATVQIRSETLDNA